MRTFLMLVIPYFCGWFPSQRPRADSTEKSRPKPKYHKLSQESLESILKKEITKWAALAFLSISSEPTVNNIVII